MKSTNLRRSSQLSTGRIGVGRGTLDHNSARRIAADQPTSRRGAGHDNPTGRDTRRLRSPDNHAFRAGAIRVARGAQSPENIGTETSAHWRLAHHSAGRKTRSNGPANDDAIQPATGWILPGHNSPDRANRKRSSHRSLAELAAQRRRAVSVEIAGPLGPPGQLRSKGPADGRIGLHRGRSHRLCRGGICWNNGLAFGSTLGAGDRAFSQHDKHTSRHPDPLQKMGFHVLKMAQFPSLCKGGEHLTRNPSAGVGQGLGLPSALLAGMASFSP